MVDTLKPTVSTITADTDPVYTLDLTTEVVVTFSEATDGTTAPTIASTTSTNFTVGVGVWSAGDTVYTVTLTHDATVEEIAAETITANGAVDVAGNTQTAVGTTSAFVVDTKIPALTAVSIASSYQLGLAIQSADVTLSFTADEEVVSTPDVTLTGAGATDLGSCGATTDTSA